MAHHLKSDGLGGATFFQLILSVIEIMKSCGVENCKRLLQDVGEVIDPIVTKFENYNILRVPKLCC